MELISNNLKALVVHLCSLLLFLIVVFIYVAASPLYKYKVVSLGIIIFLYICLYILYFSTLIRLLKISKHGLWNCLSGVAVIVVGVLIWGYIFYFKATSLEMKSISEIWIPYNIYIYLLWPIAYHIKDPRILFYIGLLNSLFPPLAILIKKGIISKKERKLISKFEE